MTLIDENHINTISMMIIEDNLNIRRLQWKTTSLEDELNVRQPQWRKTLRKYNLFGRQP